MGGLNWPGEKIDRRVKYTKKMVLEESFITLMEKKDISKNNHLRKSAKKADINRSTFYAHYSDQYDLLRKIENKFLADIQAYRRILIKKYTEDIPPALQKNRQYIRKNARICRLLLANAGDFTFQKKIMKLVHDLIISEITGDNKITKEDAEYVYSFTVSGCVGFVQKWLDDGMKKSPRYMAE